MAKDPVDVATVKSSFELPPVELSSFALEATEGPDAGRSWIVDESMPLPMLVGQSPVCAVQLSDRQVSRRHAGIEIVDGKMIVRDLGSTNGTRVDGVAVLAAFVRAGQTIRLGSTALRVARKDAVAGTPVAQDRFGRVRGTSLAMRRLYPVLARLAAANVPVVIEGETGTGKELVAEALHENGPRASGPFVVFDCASTPVAELDTQLFGHEHPGVFEQANGGTLLVEQISALDVGSQGKLLRAIDRGEITRLGAAAQRARVDVRILATTTVDLDAEVQAGRLREDLYHRLAVARVELPPLRNRREDIDALAPFFAEQLGGGEVIDDEVLARWRTEPWPGNVRELRNAVANRVALGDLADPTPIEIRGHDGGAIQIGALVDDAVAAGVPLAVARQRVIALFEELYVEGVLERHDGHVLRAANAAGVARRYFQVLKARMGK